MLYFSFSKFFRKIIEILLKRGISLSKILLKIIWHVVKMFQGKIKNDVKMKSDLHKDDGTMQLELWL